MIVNVTEAERIGAQTLEWREVKERAVEGVRKDTETGVDRTVALRRAVRRQRVAAAVHTESHNPVRAEQSQKMLDRAGSLEHWKRLVS